ncbi:MAG: hypothetical protein ACJ8BW_23925 [Ktedonobacteraceae bacterium]
MAGIYDSNLKQLVGAYAQDFVTWLLKGAAVIRELPTHLNRAIDVDSLYEVMLDGQKFIFHLEFQRSRDVDMAKRVLEYNVFASCKFDCTVVSFILYLKKESPIIESPLVRKLPNGEEILRFNFVTIKLWEISTDELKRTGLIGLLPLLPLTRDGAKQEVVEEVVIKLLDLSDKSMQASLLSITFTLASLAFNTQEDKNWLIGRFKMFQDILRDTEIYKLIMEEGHEKGVAEGIQKGVAEGIQKGRAEGIQKGRAEGKLEGIQEQQQRELEHQRQMLLRFVQARFPGLLQFATRQVATIRDINILENLIYKIGLTEEITDDEVRQVFNDLNKDEKDIS